ncbi:23S rRNA (adenine(2503)-C(2))-methyltransferase RlmN [Candidatus Peregrinibacteria bacterium]|nr:23S rRNA (adenine(2503)-C(2))-methyltransferase RlmN [Candidatus Peregrinibacteria bacterium]
MKDQKELTAILRKSGIEKYRLKQIYNAVFNKGITKWDEITVLPQKDIEILSKELPILSINLRKEAVSKNRDTHKSAFITKDNYTIESVLMSFRDGRNSVCVSSQVGCQLGCTFCATGKLGFYRNLNYEEIHDQVLFYSQKLVQEGKRISNIVFMGMGEPFMNYDEVIRSINFFNDKSGLNIGARSITVSTSGICEGINKLADFDKQVNLAVSLHAPNQKLRENIMPIARKYDLKKLMEEIENYIKKTNRRVSYEYIMLKGINDSEECATQLSGLIKDQLCHVNLIPYNETDHAGKSTSNNDTINRFRDIISNNGIAVTVRKNMGNDIDAACGQLANKLINS